MLTQNNVSVIPLPSKNPDLNPIDHVWDLLERRVRCLQVPNNNRQLSHNDNQTWKNISQQIIQRFIVPMQARCLAIVTALGSHTHY